MTNITYVTQAGSSLFVIIHVLHFSVTHYLKSQNKALDLFSRITQGSSLQYTVPILKGISIPSMLIDDFAGLAFYQDVDADSSEICYVLLLLRARRLRRSHFLGFSQVR